MPETDGKTDNLVSRPDRLSRLLWIGGCVLVAVDVWRGRALGPAFSSTVEPFLTLGLVITAGWLAVRLGLFDGLAGRLLGVTTSRAMVVVALLSITAILSGAVNLDVAVVVALPLALGLAQGVGLDRGSMALAVASVANAASFLLPTSNLTTLLVRGSAVGTVAFLAESWLAWIGVCSVSIGALTWFALRRASDSAIVPPTIGRIERFWSPGRIARDLGAMFVIAVGLRGLLPAGVELMGGFARQAVTGSVFAAVGNNLPVASVIRTGQGGSWPAILAMVIGPNLLLPGSVATVICRRLAREEGSDLSARAFTIAGLILVPIQLGIAYLGLRIVGAV